MNAPPTSRLRNVAWSALALLAGGMWLWVCWCRLPGSSWNDLRLAPVFMAAEGVPVYNLPGKGVLNTWLYGPVPLWLWWPATWAHDAISAVLAAGVVNHVILLLAIGATCHCWPAPSLSRAERWAACGLVVLVWPEPAFRFLQADNVLLACTLGANLLLVRARDSRWAAWLAALLTAAALGCKPTALGILLGQALWLGVSDGGAAAGRQIGRTLVTGAALAAIAVHQFGWRELWFGVVTVPAHLPWVDDIAGRIAGFAPSFVIDYGLPILVLMARRRLAWSPALRLPLLMWLCTLPFGVAGVLTFGGSTNNLHGFPLLMPALLLSLLGELPSRPWRVATASGAATALLLSHLLVADHAPARPDTGRIRSLDALIRSAPGETWLPWAPLVTYFAEGRFDHAEDGIYVRFATGYPVTRAHVRAHLPPRFRALVLPREADWGAARQLAGESSTEHEIGPWRLVRWPTATESDKSSSGRTPERP